MKFLPILIALSLAMPMAVQAQTSNKTAVTQKAAQKKSTTKKTAAPKKTTARKKAAVKKTVAKSRNSKATVKRAVEATTPVQSASKRLSANELNIANYVHTGRIQCELGSSISITPDVNNQGFFDVTSGKDRFYMHPVESATGAVRMEDSRTGAVWVQLGNKSMLMNQRKGERLADDCKTSQQNEVAEAMRRAPAGPSLLGP